MIAAVVLAAGAASRFGSPKQRLFLPAVLERARAARTVDEVVVVVGAYPVETDASTVECAGWARGPGASLRRGLAALNERTEAAVVVLADGPSLAPEAIDRVVDVWRSEGGEVLAASYAGERGHPVLLARAAWPRVPDEGARALEPRLVPCDDLGSPGDVDEPPWFDLEVIERRARELAAGGTSRPEWQFALGDSSLVLRGGAGGGTPIAVDVLAATDVETARALLRRAARTVGAVRLQYVVDDPPRFGTDATAQVALARASGFALIRETDRWERGAERVETPARLSFEPVEDEPFFAAMRRTLAGTPDRALRRLQADSPSAEAARRAMEGLGRGPVAWEVATTADGAFAGVSAPAVLADGSAVIGYVGVAPEQRGNGYGVDLLARATLALVQAGRSPIRGDTDVGNLPMAKAFRRVGYTRFARRFDLEIELAGNSVAGEPLT